MSEIQDTVITPGQMYHMAMGNVDSDDSDDMSDDERAQWEEYWNTPEGIAEIAANKARYQARLNECHALNQAARNNDITVILE